MFPSGMYSTRWWDTGGSLQLMLAQRRNEFFLFCIPRALGVACFLFRPPISHGVDSGSRASEESALVAIKIEGTFKPECKGGGGDERQFYAPPDLSNDYSRRRGKKYANIVSWV